MHTTRLIAASAATLTTLVTLAPPAALAGPVSTDTNTKQCKVDNDPQTSSTAQFWQQLTKDAVAQRIKEISSQDQNLAQGIIAYTEHAPGAPDALQLQQGLVAIGANEGLGMLLPDSVAPEDTSESVLVYSVSEAKTAAAAIGTDPAEATKKALREAAASSQVRLDEIKADLFAERASEFNAIQLQVQQGLLDCVKALEPPAFPVGRYLVGGMVGVAILAVLVRALFNRRKVGRHAA